MDIGSFRRDLKAVEEGDWVTSDDIPELGDVEICVRGMSAGPAREMYDKLARAVPRNRRTDTGGLRDDDMLRIMKQVLREHLLIDIRGLTEGGKALLVDDVVARMDDPALEPLFYAISRCVQVVDGRREDTADEAAKN